MDEILVFVRLILAGLGVASDRFLGYFSIFVDLIVEYRDKEGSLPYKVWLAALKLAGMYSCVEIIIVDENGRPYLRKREEKEGPETAWTHKLHIIGTAVRLNMRLPDVILFLLKKEAFDSDELAAKYAKSASFVTTILYPEPERGTAAYTTIVRVCVPLDDQKNLVGKWASVSAENISLVIDQHRPVIGLFLSESGILPLFMDTRPVI